MDLLEQILTGETGPKIEVKVGLENSTLIPLVGGIVIAVVMGVVVSNLLFFKLYSK